MVQEIAGKTFLIEDQTTDKKYHIIPDFTFAKDLHIETDNLSFAGFFLSILIRVLPASLRCYKIIKIFLYFLPKKLDRVFDHFFEILEIFALFKINPLRAIMLDENQFYI